MAAVKLTTHRVEKPWGRYDLVPLFDDQPAEKPPVGEIWYEDPAGAPRELLVKYLFTSERLSVQVHPDDAAARARGFARGKDEAWIILSAEADSTIALGLT
ncbi:MAG: phosphoheptose isomerase, partial [Rhizobiaceae bacterium]